MKKSVLILGWVAMMFVMASCKNSGNGQLGGVQDRPEYVEVVPFGMKNIPLGHLHIGEDQFQVDDFNVAGGVDGTVHVDDVVIFKYTC